MKLPLREPELDALLRSLGEWDGYVSSALLGVEAIRACGRYGDRYAADARSFLADVSLLPIDEPILAEAAAVAPVPLRALDALHLATALSVRGEIGVFFSYDQDLVGAAVALGLPVSSPA